MRIFAACEHEVVQLMVHALRHHPHETETAQFPGVLGWSEHGQVGPCVGFGRGEGQRRQDELADRARLLAG